MKKQTLLALLITFTVTACGIARRQALETYPESEIEFKLAQNGDRGLCLIVEHPGWYGPRAISASASMAETHDIGDCTPDHRQCQAMGFHSGTDSYLGCRSMLAQQENAAEIGGAMNSTALLEAGAAFLKPNPSPPVYIPTNTTCIPIGAGFGCNQY